MESRLLNTIQEKESLEAKMGNMEQLSQTVRASGLDDPQNHEKQNASLGEARSKKTKAS